MENYLSTAFTPGVLALQKQKGVTRRGLSDDTGRSALDDHEIDHIAASDSFYLATVSETGWPYVQHRGGNSGFVKILGPTTIGWLERSGNRQYLGTGNISTNDRVAAIFVDYPTRTRLKLRGTATYHAAPGPELVAALGGGDIRNDGAITVDVAATDWNCPKYITQRFTLEHVARITDPLQHRIQQLEAQLTATGTALSPAGITLSAETTADLANSLTTTQGHGQ